MNFTDFESGVINNAIFSYFCKGCITEDCTECSIQNIKIKIKENTINGEDDDKN